MYSAKERARKVFPTPVGPIKMNEPIGRRGSFRSARERRNALLTAITASSWPMTCSFSSSAMLSSFCASFCSMRFNGTPVHFDTMWMISPPVTTTSRPTPFCRRPFAIRSQLFRVCFSESRNAAAFSRLDLSLYLFYIRGPGHAVDACTRARFVHDIDGLIRQETTRNISIGKSNSRFQRLVGKPGFVQGTRKERSLTHDLVAIILRALGARS